MARNELKAGVILSYVNLLIGNLIQLEQLGDYTMEDIVPICNHVTETSVVLVAANSQFNTLEELVAYAKEHPGEIQVGNSGTG